MQFNQDINFSQLSDDERDRREGRPFKHGKSPGKTVSPLNFIAIFWKVEKIFEDLVASLNFALKDGKLSISQRRGVITLIPKKESSITATDHVSKALQRESKQ